MKEYRWSRARVSRNGAQRFSSTVADSIDVAASNCLGSTSQDAPRTCHSNCLTGSALKWFIQLRDLRGSLDIARPAAQIRNFRMSLRERFTSPGSSESIKRESEKSESVLIKSPFITR